MHIKKMHMFSVVGKKIMSIAVVAVFFFCLPIVHGQEAAENISDTKTQVEADYSANLQELMHFLQGRTDTFKYKRVGRPDPFMPFVSEKVVTSDLEVPEEMLVGMQKFEPGQLTLVAIVFSEDGPLAMVEDSVGKGYVIRNGTKVGRAGIVDSISSNLVVIKQKYKTSAGEERYKIVEMLLNKEGER